MFEELARKSKIAVVDYAINFFFVLVVCVKRLVVTCLKHQVKEDTMLVSVND